MIRWQTIEERNGYRLLRGERGYTVVGYKNGTVYSAMPGDTPDSGEWMARATDVGIDYVTRGHAYSRSWARRVFRRLCATMEG